MPEDNTRNADAAQTNPSGNNPKDRKRRNGHANGHGHGHARLLSDLDGLSKLGSLHRDSPPPPPPLAPVGDDDAETEIARLASLKPLVFERAAAAAAERLGLPVAILRRLVTLERRVADRSKDQGQPLALPEIEPWPTPVDGGWLLGAITDAIRRYVVMGLAEAQVIALWVVAAHCFSVFAVFSRLFITAAEKQCGKTTLLDTLSLLVPRPLAVSNTSPAALFRTIAMLRMTMLLDEFDAYLKEVAEELRQIIDAGHKRGGMVLRVVGDNHQPRMFDVYAPMVIASIDAIAATLMDRSIIIRLHRRLASEVITPLRLDRAPEMGMLARQIARWAADHAAELADADPAMGNLINRAADNWRPLFAVAELAGNGWRDLADDAAATVMASALDTESARTLLLTDIRALFAACGADRLVSAQLVQHLHSLEHRPWPEWGKTRKPISTVQVARLLKPLRISPDTIRLPGGGLSKGYYKSAFRDAFARYLPPEVQMTHATKTGPTPRLSRNTVTNGRNAGDFVIPKRNKGLIDVAFQNRPKPRHAWVCYGVTDQKGGWAIFLRNHNHRVKMMTKHSLQGLRRLSRRHVGLADAGTA